MTRRPLVLVVGSPSPRRQEVARTLIARGRAVVVCNGPPGCPLIREERCGVVGAADVAVVLEPRPHRRETAIGLQLCAEAARRCVVGGPQAEASDLADRVDAKLANA